MIPVQHIDPEDLPLYAMQLLPAEEAATLREHLQHSPEARRVLSETYGDLVILASTAETQSPPAHAKQRLLQQVAREKKVLPFPPSQVADFAPRTAALVEEPAARTAAAKVLPWLGWAVAAGLAVQAGFLVQSKHQLERSLEGEHAQLAQSLRAAENSRRVFETLRSPTVQNVVLTPGEGRVPPEGRVSYDAGKGALVFVASNLEPLGTTKAYELWLLPADGSGPIPAGTFHPDSHGDASVMLPELPKGTAAKGFGVTVENAGGSLAPTSAIILKGLTA